MTLRIVAIMLALFAMPALSADHVQDEMRVREALSVLMPSEMTINSIRPAPMPGFYEAVLSGLSVVYVSSDGKYLMQGALLDTRTRETGNPKYTVTVFTDIDCGFCRRLHQQIGEYNRLGIAVKYLFFPRAGVGSESFNKAVAVWCSTDRQKALTDAKAGVSAPVAVTGCDNPVARDYQLGRDVGVEGTPAVYSQDGVQLGGYVAPNDMLQRLDALASAATHHGASAP